MALDDRDRSFEKALARHLRYIAPSGADSGASATMPCPDPEILAAYHDGLLGSEERELWKQHVLSCDRCQLVLEHLATPLDVPSAQQSAEKTLSGHAASSERMESQTVASPARAAAPVPVIAIRPRKMYLRWLVPAGAIAAVLLVVVVVENSRSVFRRAPEQIEVANNRQPVVAPPAGSSGASAETDALRAKQAPLKEAAQENENALASSAVASSGGLASRAAEAKRQRERMQSAQQSPFAYAQKAAHGPAVSQQQQQRQMASGSGVGDGMGPALDKKKDESQAAAEMTAAGRDIAAKAVPAAPPPAPSIAENQRSFLAGDSLNRRSAEKAAAAAAPAQSSAAKARTGATGGAAPDALSQTVSVESSSLALMARADAFRSAPVFGPPASSGILWRVGPGGSIEHSMDNGATWSPQSSGVTSNLTTGIAISPKVCWVVGASGTILRTIDGGVHWIKISSPVADDLIDVRSTDAFHATIWFVDDPKAGTTKSFKTDDGGIHWSSAAND